jgi:hypothetical protein
MINWLEERPKILEQSLLHGVDPFLIAAIRHSENGGPGKEFGILSKDAPDYDKQLQVCCATIRNKFIESAIIFINKSYSYGIRACYTQYFIERLQRTYCPVGVNNDLTGLNKSWLANVTEAYGKFCRLGRIE